MGMIVGVWVIVLIILSLRGVFGGPLDFFLFIVVLVATAVVSHRIQTGRWLP